MDDLAKLKKMLEESYADIAAGRCHEWTDSTLEEIKALGRKRLKERSTSSVQPEDSVSLSHPNDSEP